MPLHRDSYRVLVIGDRVPTPQREGASMRMMHLLSALRSLNAEVSFAAHFPGSWLPYSQTLAQDTRLLEDTGTRVLAPPAIESAEKHLTESGASYDVILLFPESIAFHYLEMARAYAPNTVIVFDAMDLAHIRLYRQAKVRGNIPNIQRAMKAKTRELWLAQHADCTLTVSEEERQILRQAHPEADVRIASYVAEPQDFYPSFAERADLIFLGSFPHRANADAVIYFVNDILPLVRRAIPEIKLTVIGSEPPPDVQTLASDTIRVSGYVPEFAPYLEQHRLFVAPIQWGAGIKTKLLESMRYGLPVVTTSIGAEGLHVQNGESALIADTPEAFAEAVKRLYRDESLWARVAQGAAAVLGAHFSERALQEVLSGVFELADKKHHSVKRSSF